MKELQLAQYETNFMSEAASGDLSNWLTVKNSQEYMLFAAVHHVFPNIIEEGHISVRSFLTEFLKHHSNLIKDISYAERAIAGSGQAEADDVFIFLQHNILLVADHTSESMRLLFRGSNMAVIDQIRMLADAHKFTKCKKNQMSLLVQLGASIRTKFVAVNQVSIDFSTNYNEDFLKVHHLIEKRFNTPNDKGVVLLYGKPGTGKTTYIRHLIATVDKNVIFMPPQLAKSITHPDVLRILMDNPNSILVIEDAEELIMDRGVNKESPVSALLNLTDGLLADCLNIQIVCSFNSDLSNVDKALTRKGRLIASYEFKQLEVDRANHLAENLGSSRRYDLPVVLTEIFNSTEAEFEVVSKRVIGFK